MARKRILNNTSFSGLGLKPSEDKILISILKEKQISFKQVLRVLVRSWIEEIKKEKNG